MIIARVCFLSAAFFLSRGFEGRAADSKIEAAPLPDLTLRVSEQTGELEILFQDRRLMLYVFRTNQFKPYVRELFTLSGQNVLRDAPADHLHHHGLMYAIRVNGHNFWEEASQAGREHPVKILTHGTSKTREGLPLAAFTHLIHWITPLDLTAADTARAALLIERRTMTLTLDRPKQEVTLQWHSEFEVGPGARGKAVLTGSNYNGLGLRFPTSLDRVARHQNSENLPYHPRNEQTVIAAKWSAVSGLIDGREVSVALFADPKAIHGTTKFFTMLEPFTYLSVTQSLNESPLEYPAGGSFSVNYLLTIYPGAKDGDFLQQRYGAWVQGIN